MTQAIKLLNILLLILIPIGVLNTTSSPFAGGKFIILQFVLGFFLTIIGIEAIIRKKTLLYLPSKKNHLAITAFAIYATCLIYTLFSQTPIISIFGSLNRFMGMYTYSLLFIIFLINVFLIPNTQKKPIQKTLLKTIILSANLLSIYGILQSLGIELFFKNFSSGIFHGRIFSLSGNPSYLAQLLSLSTLISVFYHKKHLYYKSSAILQFTALILTSTRSSFIAFIFGLIILNITTLKKHLKKYLVIIIVITTAFIASNASQILSPNSLQSRIQIWSSTIELIKEKPLGYGLENIETFFPLKQSPEFNIFEDNIYKTVDKIHNQPLSILYQSGIPGFLIYIYAISILIYRWHKETSQQKKLVFILIATNIIQNLLNFFDLTTLLILTVLFSLQINTKYKKAIKSKINTYLFISSFFILSILNIYNASIYLNGLTHYKNYKHKFYTSYEQSQSHLRSAINLLPNQTSLYLELGYSNLEQRLTVYNELSRITNNSPQSKIWLAKGIEEDHPELANNILTNIHNTNKQNPVWLLELLLHQKRTNNPQSTENIQLFKEMFKTIWEPPFTEKDKTFIQNFPDYEKLKNTQ